MKTWTMHQALQVWEKFKERRLIPTGILPLDAALGGGLPVRQITTIGAYTGEGKSELARQFARYAIGQGFYIKIVDVELGPDRIFERFLCQETKSSRQDLATKKFDNYEEERQYDEAIDKLIGMIRFSISTPDDEDSVDEMFKALGKELDESLAGDTPTMLIFDSIQRLSQAEGKNTMREDVTYFMRHLESFTHSHNAATIAISEMSRSKTGGVPKRNSLLTALAEGRAIEYVSDVVMFLVPTDTKIKDEKFDDEITEHTRWSHILIKKNRNGGTGLIDCKLGFTRPYWDMHVAADVKQQEEESVLDIFRDEQPHTIEEIAKTLKKRRSVTALIVRGFVRQRYIRKDGKTWVGTVKLFRSPHVVKTVPGVKP